METVKKTVKWLIVTESLFLMHLQSFQQCIQSPLLRTPPSVLVLLSLMEKSLHRGYDARMQTIQRVCRFSCFNVNSVLSLEVLDRNQINVFSQQLFSTVSNQVFMLILSVSQQLVFFASGPVLESCIQQTEVILESCCLPFGHRVSSTIG